MKEIPAITVKKGKTHTQQKRANGKTVNECRINKYVHASIR